MDLGHTDWGGVVLYPLDITISEKFEIEGTPEEASWVKDEMSSRTKRGPVAFR